MSGVDTHEIRGVPFAAPFYQNASGLFFLVHHLLNVKDIPKSEEVGIGFFQLAEKDLAVIQMHGLVFGGKREITTARTARQKAGQQQEGQEDIRTK
jgi:hypothetical protein